MSKKETPQNKQLNECVLGWLEKLSAHFNQPQDEEQVKIFLHALRNCTIYQVDTAFERCLNECEFVPKLKEVHARMPEQRYPPENPGAFRGKKPFLDLIKPLKEEFSEEIMGKRYTDLNPKELYELSAQVTRVYYLRIGAKQLAFKPTEQDIERAARKPWTDWANI